MSEASLNGFPSSRIAARFQEDPYRFLVCADKFQTGYDEPLLHTMYVDKTLSGIKAVQTLSRLNRAHPKKHDVFVLDFLNDVDTIHDAFADFYRATILADETDPNKLHDLQAGLDAVQVYSEEQVDDFVKRYLGGAERDQLDPILDACVAVYKRELKEDGQVDFKGKAKGFVRTYNFLSCVLPYTNADWEKRSIFLNFLVPKLPAPEEDDLSKGILETIEEDADRVRQLITETIPARVAADTAFRNAQQNSDKQNARIEHDKALVRVMTSLMKDPARWWEWYSWRSGGTRFGGHSLKREEVPLFPLREGVRRAENSIYCATTP